MDPNDTTCVSITSVFQKEMGDITTNSFVQALFGCVYVLIFLAGLFTNGAVVYLVCNKKQFRTVRNLFIVSLSCADLLICLTAVIVTPITSMLKIWYFGEFLCYFFPLFQCMSVCVSTMSLTCVAIDRYILIVHPAKRPITRNCALFMIFFIWCLAAGLGVPSMLHSKLFEIPGYCGQFCHEEWSQQQQNLDQKVYGASVLVVQFVLPFFVICFCYGMISLKLSLRADRRASIQTQEVARRNVARRRRTNRLLMTMCLVFALCWSLQVVQNMLFDYDHLPDFVEKNFFFVHLLTHCIAMTTVISNPILYSFLNEDFRRSVIELCPCFWFRRGHNRPGRVGKGIPLQNASKFVNQRSHSQLKSHTSHSIGMQESLL